jgi:hypothetical protein
MSSNVTDVGISYRLAGRLRFSRTSWMIGLLTVMVPFSMLSVMGPVPLKSIIPKISFLNGLSCAWEKMFRLQSMINASSTTGSYTLRHSCASCGGDSDCFSPEDSGIGIVAYTSFWSLPLWQFVFLSVRLFCCLPLPNVGLVLWGSMTLAAWLLSWSFLERTFVPLVATVLPLGCLKETVACRWALVPGMPFCFVDPTYWWALTSGVCGISFVGMPAWFGGWTARYRLLHIFPFPLCLLLLSVLVSLKGLPDLSPWVCMYQSQRRCLDDRSWVSCYSVGLHTC